MRILLVDDHAAVRGALRQLIEHGLDGEVVGEASDGAEAIALTESLRPEVVLLDAQMPGLSGAETATALSATASRPRIVALTASAEAGTVTEMIAAGADSYLIKTAPPAELRAALRRILDGEAVLAPEVLPGVVGQLAERLRAEQSRAEALSAVGRAKQEFLSLVSDRLATPLTAITGYTKTLTQRWDRLDEEIKLEFLASIERQCERLSGRLEQITAVARLQQEGAPPGLGFSLDGMARDVVAQLEADLAGRVCTLELAPTQVAADRRAIWGVIRSLLDNAILYTRGSITIRVRTSDGEGVLEVCDEGPGMAAHRVPTQLAQPFQTGDASDSSPNEGLGLSLYAAARVLELCAGRLVIDTAPDRGTVAAVVLPLSAA